MRVLPAEGPYSLRYRTGKTFMKKEFAGSVTELWDKMSQHGDVDCFYSTAGFCDETSPDAANVRAKRTLYLDLDGYKTQTDAIKAVIEFCQAVSLPWPGFVLSGHGVHAYWPLDADISPAAWLPYATGLKLACKEKELKADGAVTADPARILRCPGTFNCKKEPKTEVTIHDVFFTLGPYSLDEFAPLLSYVPEVKGLPVASPEARFEGSAELNEHTAAYYASALDAISPEDRDVWMKMGMAVFELGWGDVGFNMWDAWSKRSDKYDEEEQKKIWASFPKYRETHLDNLVTPGSLIHFAAQAGWTAPVGITPSATAPFVPPPELLQKAKKGDRYDLHCAVVRAAGPELSGTGCFVRNSFPNARFGLVTLDVQGRRNEFTGSNEVKLKGGEWQQLTDDLELMLSVQIMGVSAKVDPGEKATRRAIRELCNVGAYHPVRNYLRGLEDKWDGKYRLGDKDHPGWLTNYLGASDTSLNRFYGATTLIAAVRRAMRDEYVPFDHMLVLEGPQGTGKSTVVRILGHGIAPGGWYKNQEINWADQRTALEVFRGCWFYEWSELAGHGKVEQSHIKRCLSSPVDEGRLAYEHNPKATARHTILIGTTNLSEDYLTDQTGARRYWCVKTGDEKFKLDEFRHDRDQLFAEALVREKTAGVYLDPPSELFDSEREVHEDRTEQPVFYDDLARVGRGKDDCTREGDIEWILTKDIKERYCPLEKKDVWLDRKISAAMSKLGWTRSRRRVDGVQLRCFERQIKQETEQ